MAETNNVVTIEYNNAVMVTLAAGQTATLSCKDKAMNADLVVSVPAKMSDPILQEKTALGNGEVTPDDGYDGLSKVIVAVPTQQEYRYIKFVMNGLRDNDQGRLEQGKYAIVQFSELEFVDEDNTKYIYPSGTTVNAYLTSKAEDAYYDSEAPDKIIDGDLGTKFCSDWVSGDYLIIDLGEDNAIDISVYSRFRWYTANDAPDRDPVSFAVYFSNDGVIFDTGNSVVNADITEERGALAYTGYCTSSKAAVLQEKTVTENGEVTPDDGFAGLSKVTVNVASPLPIEVSTEAEMTALLESGEAGGVYKYTGTTGAYDNGALYVLIALSGGKVWRKLSGAIEPYLTFSSPSSFTLNVVDNKKYWDGTLEYSTDLSTWNVWDGTTTLSADNGKLYMRGMGNTLITGPTAYYFKPKAGFWVLTGSDISCSGNIENLLDYTMVATGRHPTMASHCYYYMFYGCTSLTTAPELPATTLAERCYASMFNGCTSLTATPELPATTLANNCYSYMFYRCTNLTTAPELPATTLTDECYSWMFSGCTSLTVAPKLPATTLANHCYSYMFYRCTNLTTAPELPATTLANHCYYHMFNGCTSLTVAPELPATTLANYCYSWMFSGCTSLTTAPELPATTLAEICYRGMFEDCTSLTVAPELPATTLAEQCYCEMLRRCTSLTTAPKLPATTLAKSCYSSMFDGCTSLTVAPKLPATTLANMCYNDMFENCTSLTTVPELPATTLAGWCYGWMFSGCTSIKLSTAQSEEYPTPYRIPTSGEGTSADGNALTYMFDGTGGTFTGTPEINTTYYLHSSNSVV